MALSGKKRAEKARQAQELFAAVSESDVAAGLRRCVDRLAQGHWLDPASIFSVDGPNAALDLDSSELAKEYDDVCDYAAASSVLHCVDAWGYLGRSLNAVSAGLLAEAVHFAYYAEVRAAVSILASGGIVVGNGHSHALCGQGDVRFASGQSTHQAVWRLLELWSSSPQGVATIGSIVKVRGRDLQHWLDSRGASGNTTSTIATLLQNWGADLAAQTDDNLRRNVASYQPTRLRLDGPHRAEWIRITTTRVCELIEPGTPGSFPRLDRELLLQSLRGVGNASQSGTVDVASIVESLFGGRGQAADLAVSLQADLNKTDSIVAKATINPPVAYPVRESHLEGMLGRALILARLATGYAERIQRLAGLDPEQLTPWADNLGRSLGYWDPSPRPEQLVDLWSDIESGLEEIDLHFPTGPKELELLLRRSSAHLVTVSGLTRAALWSLSA